MTIYDQLQADGWRTPDTYCKHFSKIPESSGLYLFLKVDLDFLKNTRRDRVMYVGMSENISKRVMSHNIKPMIICDYLQTWFKPLDIEILRKSELKVIRKYSPPYNISGKLRGENV